MAYIRRKTTGGNTYFQVVRSYRENGKVKQEVLAYLGKDPTPEAIEAKIRHHDSMADQHRQNAQYWLTKVGGANGYYTERYVQEESTSQCQQAEYHERLAKRLREAVQELDPLKPPTA